MDTYIFMDNLKFSQDLMQLSLKLKNEKFWLKFEVHG